ncbi:MAG: TonB-dependent receptor, partial [Chitinophagales bacterium]|nr:TonB-dependent receptor [Chitinophagales bacterium]
YAMFDNKAGDKFRMVWGARLEFFKQHLESFENSASTEPDPIVIDTEDADSIGLPFDFLPSVNIIYSLTDKFNIRLAGSKTVVRPELRELAPFGFYDYENSVYVIGNDTLKSTDIFNGDLRFEFYPGLGQILSASLFYKYFQNPIEISKYNTGFYQQLKPINEDFAKNFGFELEVRKNFSFISDKPFFKNLSFNANYAYIKSVVEVTDTAYYGVSERPLQGQSPFVFNTGLTYLNPKTGFSITGLYNVIGRRINELGYKNYPDIYENPRPQLDAQASIPFLKNGIVRLTLADILSRDAIFYQDMDESGDYEEDADQLIAQINTGSRVSLSVSYRF